MHFAVYFVSNISANRACSLRLSIATSIVCVLPNFSFSGAFVKV